MPQDIVRVLYPVGHAAEESVPGEVVQLVRIQGPGQEAAEEDYLRIPPVREILVHDGGNHTGIRSRALQERPQGPVPDAVPGQGLVFPERELLQGVREREMAQVVAEGRGEKGDRPRTGDAGKIIPGHKFFQSPPGRLEDPDGMGKPRVGGAGVNQVRGPELAYAHELREGRRLQDRPEGRGKVDVFPYGIPYGLHEIHAETIGYPAHLDSPGKVFDPIRTKPHTTLSCPESTPSPFASPSRLSSPASRPAPGRGKRKPRPPPAARPRRPAPRRLRPQRERKPPPDPRRGRPRNPRRGRFPWTC